MPTTYETAVETIGNVRKKYPQYSDMDDATLATKIAAKYPVYSDIAAAFNQNKPQAASVAVKTAAGADVNLTPAQAEQYGRELQATPLNPNTYQEQSTGRQIAGALVHPVAGLGAFVQDQIASKRADIYGADDPGYKALKEGARNLYLYDKQSQQGAASAATGLATGIATVATPGGPLVAGLNAAGRKLYEAQYDEEKPADDHFVLKAIADGGLEFAFNKLMQTGLTADAAKIAIEKVAPYVGKPIATLAARTAIGGGSNAAMQVGQNAIEGRPLGENVGTAAAQGALIENVGGLIHDTFAAKAPEETKAAGAPAEPTPAASVELQPAAAAPNAEVTQAETSAEPSAPAAPKSEIPPELQAIYDAASKEPLPTEIASQETLPAGQRSAEDMMDLLKIQDHGEMDMAGARELVGNSNYELKDVPIDQLRVRGSTEFKQNQIEEYAKLPAKSAPPVVADASGQIINGNRRLEAAKLRGDKTVKAYVPVETKVAPDRLTQITDTSKPITERTGLDANIAKAKALLAEDTIKPPKTPAEASAVARESIKKSPPPAAPPDEPGVSFSETGQPHDRKVPQIAERILTPVISRIHDLHPPTSRLVRDMYRHAGELSAAWKNDVRPGLTGIEDYIEANPAKAQEIKNALFNEDAKGIKAVLPPELHKGVDEYFAARSNAFTQQKDAGVKLGDIGDRVPRRVIDSRGLREALGSDAGVFDEAIKLRTKAKGSPLTVEEANEVYSDVVSGYGPRKPGSVGPIHARARSLETVPEAMQKFYENPLVSAIDYFNGAAKAVERAKFLGKGDDPALLQESIGKLLNETASDLPPSAQNELNGLLQTLFLADTKSISKPIQRVRRAIYATALSHTWSGISQLTDTAIQAARYNIKSAVGGFRDAIGLTPADERYMLKDMGMDHPGQEFGDSGKLNKLTEGGLIANFFKKVDVLTKESGMNTARRFMTDAAKNPDGSAFAKLARDWVPVYGEQGFAEAMGAFRRGDIHNDTARSIAFAHLTQMQPMTIANMPENYLKMGDGRLLYTLHTFQLQQIDMLRRDIARKLRTPGQHREGLNNLGRVVLMAGVAGLGKDFIKDFMTGSLTHKSMGERGFDAILGLVGLNRYVSSEFKKHPIKTILDMGLPPMSQFDAPFVDFNNLRQGKLGEKGVESFKLLPIPYVNDLLYYWTPLGAGYHKKEADAKSDWGKKLDQVYQDAYNARQSGDSEQARTYINLYNKLQAEHPSKGRRKSLDYSSLEKQPARAGK